MDYTHFMPSLTEDPQCDAARAVPADVTPRNTAYDPELIYVECHLCGHPVLWESGRTTALLLAGGIDPRTLDERCLIISDGCTTCRPGERDGYGLAVVRIAGLAPDEAVLMEKPAGHA